MLKAWNIIDCGLTGRDSGHHYWEAKALANELDRRGVVTRIFCHKGISEPSIPSAQIFPVFPLSLYDLVSKDPIWGHTENFVIHNRIFLNTLAGLDRSSLLSSLLLMPNITECQMLGAVRWLAGFNDRERPKTMMLLEPAKGWSNERSILAKYKKIWAQCPTNVKRDITLGVRLPMLAEQYAAALGIAPAVLPHPFALPEGANPTPLDTKNAKLINVSFVGGARRERGVSLIPEVVEKCSSMHVRFIIQMKPGEDRGFDGSKLAELGARASVQLYQGPMPAQDYYNVIANSVVLLVYDSNRYQCRGSGVYLEAKCLGAPVIVSPGNWVADEVRLCGNGIVCEERSVDAIVDAIVRAERKIDDLRARAAAIAIDYRTQHGAACFVDSVLGLVGEKVA